MTRRGFLGTLLAVPLALAVKPAPAWPVTALGCRVTRYKVLFPDGEVLEFAGYVTNITPKEIGVIPTGPVTYGGKW
jgi:hypothetical protein